MTPLAPPCLALVSTIWWLLLWSRPRHWLNVALLALALAGCAKTTHLLPGESVVIRDAWQGTVMCVGAESNCAIKRVRP